MSAQAQTVASVARRGYLDGWNDDELLARQVVKLLEELGELASTIETDDPAMSEFFASIVRAGKQARYVFDHPAWFAGATIADTKAARHELVDCEVVLAVMAHALDVPDLAFAASQKALADEVRGVRKQGRVTGPDANGHYGFGCVLVPLEADDGK